MKRSGPAVLGIFAHEDRLLGALRRLKGEGHRVTVLSPVRRKWLEEAADKPAPSPVRVWSLFGGLLGIGSAIGLAVYTFARWRLIMSGKPVIPYVPLVVVGFEGCVLFGALLTFGAMLAIGRIPSFRLPGYYDPRFTRDRFGLLVPISGPGVGVRTILREAGAEEVRDVEA